MALLQSVGKGTRRAAIEGAVRSGCFEFEPLAEDSDSLRESVVAEPEGTLDNACLAADVARDVEGSGVMLPLMIGPRFKRNNGLRVP